MPGGSLTAFLPPTHPPTHAGSTALKRRLLVGRGWTIVDVPFFEWQALSGEGARRAYIAAKLEAAGFRLSPGGRLPQGGEAAPAAGVKAEGWRRQQGGKGAVPVAAAEAKEEQEEQGAGKAAAGGGDEKDEQAEQVQARARRLAMLKFARGQLSRQGLAAKEGGLRVAAAQRRRLAAGE